MVAALALGVLSLALEARAETPPPFANGELLVYRIAWMGIPAGHATMAVRPLLDRDRGNRRVYHIVSTARSNEMVSLFYPVDDRTDSYMDARGLYSLWFKLRQREGRYRSDKEIRFDQQAHRALYIHNGKAEWFDTVPEVQDALSGLYFLRTLTLEPGRPVTIPVFDSRKNWQVEVRVLQREEVVTPAGTFRTVKVKPLLKSEGIFRRKGDVHIWLTDDARKIPVKMKSAVKIGSITATLVEWREHAPTAGSWTPESGSRR